MVAMRWNGKKYEAVIIPEIPPQPGVCFDMDYMIHCPNCKKAVTFGESYTSRRWFFRPGVFGMYVCPACHEEEWNDAELNAV